MLASTLITLLWKQQKDCKFVRTMAIMLVRINSSVSVFVKIVVFKLFIIDAAELQKIVLKMFVKIIVNIVPTFVFMWTILTPPGPSSYRGWGLVRTT